MRDIDRVQGKNTERVLKYITGMLYFYGVMSFDDLYNMLAETIKPDLSREDLQVLLDSNARLEKTPYIFNRHENLYSDIDVGDINWVLAQQGKRKDIPFRPVSEDETRLVVDEQYPHLWSPKEQAVYAWLLKKCKDVTLSMALPLEYAAEIKNGMHPDDLLEKVQSQLKLGNASEEVKAMIMDFAAATPQWALKGWTAAEVAEKKFHKFE